MKGLSIFFSKHKVLNVIVCIIAVWVLIWCYDMYRVDIKEDLPACCFETPKGSGHYVGAGYSFDIYDHPITGKQEFALYVFGNEIKSTFTD